MRLPMMSGHCRFPETKHPEHSHERCQRMGHGNTASPSHEFSPCPCRCHLNTDEFECGNCGVALREAPHWPNEDEPGEMIYVHVDEDGCAVGEECETKRRRYESEPESEPEEEENDLVLALTEIEAEIETEADDDFDDLDFIEA